MTWNPYLDGGASRPSTWQRPKLTPTQREEIKRRYAEGETATSLAAEFKVSAGTVNNRVPPRSTNGRPEPMPMKLDAEQRAEVRQQMEAGEKIAIVAERYGVSRHTIRKYLTMED